jgi:pilus assembly protein Flp/PilA
MRKFLLATDRFLRDEDGVTAIEYGLIASLVGVAAIAALQLLGGGLTTVFTNIANCLTTPATC